MQPVKLSAKKFFFAIMLFVTLFLVPSVYAQGKLHRRVSPVMGSNGQQLQITFRTTLPSCGGSAKSITVTGPNQYGNTTTWSRSLSYSYCGTASVVTTGYWWKGQVKIVIRYGTATTTTGTVTCYRTVPKTYGTNVYPVTCYP